MACRTDPGGVPSGGERGFALIAVIFLTLLITVVGLAYFALAGNEVREAQYQRDYAQAFWAAETGLDRTVVWLNGLTNNPPTTRQTPFVNQAIGNGTYDVEATPDAGNPTTSHKKYSLRAVGRCGRAERIMVAEVEAEGFEHYGYFTDEEKNPGGDTIWFFTGDDVGGKIHSNDPLHIKGSPRFRGPVTSMADHMVAYLNTNVYGPSGWPAGSNNPTFDQGFTLGVPEIELPVGTMDLKTASQGGGLTLTGNYEMQFGRTTAGTVSYRRAGTSTWTNVTLSTLTSGVIHVTGTVQVSGVLDGRITLGATQNIELIGDLRYAAANATTGQPTASCDDMMGLVSERNVVVRDVSANYGDMVIDATVMALNTSFLVENHDHGSPRGTLHIWGGLIQQRRGPVGTAATTSLKSGYLKDYHFDSKVNILPPPYFPVTKNYVRLTWTEKGPAV